MGAVIDIAKIRRLTPQDFEGAVELLRKQELGMLSDDERRELDRAGTMIRWQYQALLTR